MKRSVSGVTTPNIWNITDAAPSLETYADQPFDTSDNQTWLMGDPDAGTFCRRDVCSVANGVLTVPTLTNFDTTEDSPNNQAATYSTYIRAANQQLIPWLLNYRVPVGSLPISWDTLRIHKGGIIQRSPLDTYTKTEILALIEQQIDIAIGDLNRAAVGQLGRIETATTPADPFHPKAVIDSDPRVIARYYVGSYISFAAAIAAIGSTRATLVVPTQVTTSAITVPANVTLEFTNTGGLSVTTGQTLTIRGPIVAPPIQVFYNALAGQGTVSFSGNGSLNFLEVQWWGATIDGITDDTPAWLATVTAGYTLKVATILMPNGISLVSSIALPAYSSAGNEGVSITIEGVGMPPIETGTFPGTLAATTRASIIKSTTAGTAGVFTQVGTPFQAVSLTFKNCCVRREPNPTGPGIDGTNNFGLYLENVLIDTGQYTTAVTQPTHAAGIGVVFPGNNNAASQSIHGDVFIQGFFTGVQGGEHLTQTGNLTISACAVGMEFTASNHAMTFGRVSLYNNTTNIKISGACYFNIQELDLEHADSGAFATPVWQDTVTDLYDASNLGRGRIRIHVVKANVGVVSTFTKNGGFFVTVDEIRYEAQKDVFIRNSADLVIPDTTDTTLSFNTVDENLAYADLSDTSRIRPTQYGVVTLFANVSFAANATGVRTLEIWKHDGGAGTDLLVATSQIISAGAAKATIMQLTAFVTASNPADYFFVSVKQTSGGNLNVTATSSPDFTSPRFIMQY